MSKAKLIQQSAKLLAKQTAHAPNSQDVKHCIALIEHIVERLYEGGATAQYLPSQAVRIYQMSLE